MEQWFDNARLVTGDEIISGSLLVRNGVITAVEKTDHSRGSAVDCSGDLLIPGLVELHTDNLEKTIQPRPGVIWPSMIAAVLAHDSQLAGAGITTVFDAVALGGWRADSLRARILEETMAVIEQGQHQRLFRCEHRVHLRCELADEHMERLLLRHGGNPVVGLLSMMDHTPGQRQWTDIARWRLYHREKKWTDEEADLIVAELTAKQHRYADANRRTVAAFAQQQRLALASHDDTTAADCLQSVHDGATIAEFPTTLEAAQAARNLGMAVLMGAPNAVRGASHSGNVTVAEIAGRGLLDGLSSDYVPASLLHAAFVLANSGLLSVPGAVALVTKHPARLAGLADRGEIAVGKRADLVRVAVVDAVPVVRQVWQQGVRIH